jgi:hypothetical protein
MDIERLTAAARAAGYAMAASEDPLSLPLDCQPAGLIDPQVSEADYRDQPFVGEAAGAGPVSAWIEWPALEWVASYLQRLGGMPARAGSWALRKPMQHLAKMPREPKMALAFQQR